MSTTYDSSRVSLQIGGVPMDAFGDNKIIISRNNDASSVIEGVDGTVLFAKSNKLSGTVSFDLIYGTDYDTYMDAVSGVNYQIPVTFQCLDSFKALATWGMVQAQPDISLGETPESRTWIMNVASVDMAVAGGLSFFTAAPQPQITALRF